MSGIHVQIYGEKFISVNGDMERSDVFLCLPTLSWNLKGWKLQTGSDY